jgi:hypothetical protein
MMHIEFKEGAVEFPRLYIPNEDQWFVPYVGMVYRSRNVTGDVGYESETWELVSYGIK